MEGFLDKVLFKDGDFVNKGRLLFLIQPEQYQAQLQKAEASVLAEKAQLEHAQTEFVRYSRLVKEDAAAQTDVDRWHYERDSRRAGVMAAQAQVTLAKLNLSYTRVTAPFDGRMGRHLKDPGTLVGAGEQTLLAEINQIKPMYVYFNINEQDLLRVRGQKPPGAAEEMKEAIPGVSWAWPMRPATPTRGTWILPASRLTPPPAACSFGASSPTGRGSSCRGCLPGCGCPSPRKRGPCWCPKPAIGYDQLGAFVRVVGPKNVVERRGVKLGNQVDEDRVVLEGLHRG